MREDRAGVRALAAGAAAFFAVRGTALSKTPVMRPEAVWRRGFFMGDDARHMMRALELAAKAAGRTAPNPLVGCVVVKDGAVVGEGWHEGPGLDHAEAMALKAAGGDAKDATLYVTLEPCNHQGKTPPCVDAVLAAGVAEVVYAMADPNLVASGGAARLEKAGVAVRGGVCEQEAREQNRFWLHSLNAARPFVVAKFAMSLDGRIATREGDSKWITGSAARERAHRLRRSVDAIIVGAGTVIADDPALTARTLGEPDGYPLRVVLDSTGRTPFASAVYDRAGRGALLATTAAAPKAALDRYRELGADVRVYAAGADGRPDLADLLADLKTLGCMGVMVEGGGETLGGFFDAGLVDEVQAFIAPLIIGGGRPAVAGEGSALIADARRLADVKTEQLGPDLLVSGKIERGAA